MTRQRNSEPSTLVQVIAQILTAFPLSVITAAQIHKSTLPNAGSDQAAQIEYHEQTSRLTQIQLYSALVSTSGFFAFGYMAGWGRKESEYENQDPNTQRRSSLDVQPNPQETTFPVSPPYGL